MSYCIEVSICRVHPGKVDDFIEVNRERRKKMLETVPSCRELLLVRLPFLDNTFLRCVFWKSKEEAMKYSGERLQREGYLKFLAENVKDLGVFFVDGIDLEN